MVSGQISLPKQIAYRGYMVFKLLRERDPSSNQPANSRSNVYKIAYNEVGGRFTLVMSPGGNRLCVSFSVIGSKRAIIDRTIGYFVP